MGGTWIIWVWARGCGGGVVLLNKNCARQPDAPGAGRPTQKLSWSATQELLCGNVRQTTPGWKSRKWLLRKLAKCSGRRRIRKGLGGCGQETDSMSMPQRIAMSRRRGHAEFTHWRKVTRYSADGCDYVYNTGALLAAASSRDSMRGSGLSQRSGRVVVEMLSQTEIRRLGRRSFGIREMHGE